MTDTCPPDKIIYDPATAEYICTANGLVLGDRIVNWAPQPNIKLNYALHDYGIGSTVSKSNKIMRYRIFNYTISSKKLYKLYKRINNIADIVQANHAVRSECIRILKSMQDKKIKMTEDEVAYALLSIAYKNLYQIPLDMLAEKLSVDPNWLRRITTRLIQELGVKIKQSDYKYLLISAVQKLPISTDNIEQLIKVASETYEKLRPLSGRTPKALTSIAIAYACRTLRLNITISTISKITRVPDATIYHGLKLLRKLKAQGLI